MVRWIPFCKWLAIWRRRLRRSGWGTAACASGLGTRDAVNRSSVVEQAMQGHYVRSIDHLHDELARIELLIRAQVIRWQRSGACAGSEADWGMVVVSRAEVERYLQSSFSVPGALAEDVRDELQPWWEKAT